MSLPISLTFALYAPVINQRSYGSIFKVLIKELRGIAVALIGPQNKGCPERVLNFYCYHVTGQLTFDEEAAAAGSGPEEMYKTNKFYRYITLPPYISLSLYLSLFLSLSLSLSLSPNSLPSSQFLVTPLPFSLSLSLSLSHTNTHSI